MPRALAYLLLGLGLLWPGGRAAGLPPILGPSLLPGTELRLFSPNLRVLYAAWRVEEGRLLPLSPPLRPEEGSPVRLVLVLPTGQVRSYPGRLERGEVWLLVEGLEGSQARYPLGQVLKEVYRLLFRSLWEAR